MRANTERRSDRDRAGWEADMTNAEAGPAKGPARLRLVGLVGADGIRRRPCRQRLRRCCASSPTSPPTCRRAAGRPSIEVSTLVVDRNDRLLRPFTTPEGRWRLPVDIDQVDRHFLDMLIAYEDKNFYAHHGIDWASMVRAGLQFIGAGGHIVSGGSTLTMQVARLVDRNADARFRRQDPADGLRRKARRII